MPDTFNVSLPGGKVLAWFPTIGPAIEMARDRNRETGVAHFVYRRRNVDTTRPVAVGSLVWTAAQVA